LLKNLRVLSEVDMTDPFKDLGAELEMRRKRSGVSASDANEKHDSATGQFSSGGGSGGSKKSGSGEEAKKHSDMIKMFESGEADRDEAEKDREGKA
jgi:hypothetical protein